MYEREDSDDEVCKEDGLDQYRIYENYEFGGTDEESFHEGNAGDNDN